MKLVHIWREELSEEWKSLTEQEILVSLSTAGEKLREKIDAMEKTRRKIA